MKKMLVLLAIMVGFANSTFADEDPDVSQIMNALVNRAKIILDVHKGNLKPSGCTPEEMIHETIGKVSNYFILCTDEAGFPGKDILSGVRHFFKLGPDGKEVPEDDEVVVFRRKAAEMIFANPVVMEQLAKNIASCCVDKKEEFLHIVKVLEDYLSVYTPEVEKAEREWYKKCISNLSDAEKLHWQNPTTTSVSTLTQYMFNEHGPSDKDYTKPDPDRWWVTMLLRRLWYDGVTPAQAKKALKVFRKALEDAKAK